jgi:D-alanine-D-alanine ligase
MTDLKNKKVGVVMGGISAEKEVSIKSGKAVLKALQKKGYDAVPVQVDKNVESQLRDAGIDIAFIVLHGGWGEDGRLQALCEILNIHYTGSGVLASGLAMNKAQAKAIFSQNDIPTPKHCPAISRDFVFDKMGFDPPVIVKPTAEGSTVGLSLVKSVDEYTDALEKAKKYDDTPMVEEFIPGRELTVGVLDGEPLGVVEIVPKSGLYDYESKYTQGATEYVSPAQIPEKTAEEVRELGKRAYAALGCKGGARVDFRLDPKRGPFVLELNTIPGMTELSLLPMSAKSCGMDFEELCERMLKSAKED